MTAASLTEKVNALETRVTCADEKTEAVEAWINGNGTPGAKVRLALLEKNVAEIKKSLDLQTKAFWGVAIGFGVWAATNLLPSIVKHIP
jgi:hypothetical protein